MKYLIYWIVNGKRWYNCLFSGNPAKCAEMPRLYAATPAFYGLSTALLKPHYFTKPLCVGYLLLLLGGLPQKVAAQLIQWSPEKQPSRQLVAAKFGADYAMVYGLEYGFKPVSKRPIWVTAGWTSAFGGELLDDWTLNLAVQGRLLKHGRFSLIGSPSWVLRRYHGEIATLLNISTGAAIQLTFDYRRWGIGGVANYEHTLGTHLKHHHLAENYPAIYNGWIGSSGGNFKFGVQTRYQFVNSAVALHVGQVFAANFKDNPTLPFYGTLAFVLFW